MKLRKVVLRCIFILISISPAISQISSCPDSTKETKFAKAMDLQFANDYKECSLLTSAIFLGTGNANYKIPSAYKKYVVFRCYPEGNEPSKDLMGQPVGYFCFIEKQKSEEIFNLKAGQKITLKGTVEVSSSLGYKQTNFIVREFKTSD